MTPSGRTVLEHARQIHPRVGIHRVPAVVWNTPRLHPGSTDVVVVEDHGGFAYGGNKVRHLDLILGLAMARETDVLLTAAGGQSNLCRVLAAAGRHLDMDVHLVLRGEQPDHPTGNQVLFELAGATIDRVASADPFGPEQDLMVQTLATRYAEEGRRPFVVDVRRDHAHVSALAETGLLDEIELSFVPDQLVVAASAGSTAAGLLLGTVARGWATRVLAVSASIAADDLKRRILDIARATAAAVGLDIGRAQLAAHLHVTDDYVGPGHGVATEAARKASRTTAHRTGLYLDHTYTGKAMAALLDDPRPGRACFILTGGGPTVFHDHSPQGATR